MRKIIVCLTWVVFFMLNACVVGCSDNGGSWGQDTTVPMITLVNSANYEIGVPVNKKISATFSEPMDEQTITTSTFTIEKDNLDVAGHVLYIGTTATFSPEADLEANTAYTATVTTGAKDLSGNSLANDYIWSFKTGAIPDSIAPTVTYVNPANLSMNVSFNQDVAVTFSEAMDISSIDPDTFFITHGNTVVPGAVTYTGTTAVFAPSSDFDADKLYIATITAVVKDLAGNSLGTDHVWSFTTGPLPDSIAPMVTAISPVNLSTDVTVNTKITATFSEGMNPLSITSNTFTLEAPVGTPVLGTVTYVGVSAVFTPASDLADYTSYTVTINGGFSGVKDLSGNQMSGDYFVSSWTTEAVDDVIEPQVTGSIIANNATNVAVNVHIGVTFSEGMDPLTVTNATFQLKSAFGTQIAGMVSYSGVSAVFVPTNDLDPSTQYTVTLMGGDFGVKDYAGNPIPYDYLISWTTDSGVDETLPTVTGVVNANGATNVSTNTYIGVTFSEGMDPLTVTNQSFRLTSSLGTPVAGTVSYSGVSAKFMPWSKLMPSTHYTLTVEGGVDGVCDLAGNPMACDFVLSWTTKATPDTTAPTVSEAINANGAADVSINTNVGATFSEGMDPLTVTTITFILESGFGTPIPGIVSYSGVSAVFNPAHDLEPSTLYIVTIKGGIDGVKDLAGNPMESDFTVGWTTEEGADVIAPEVSGTINANGAVNVPINANIGVTFSEGMDPLTVTNLTFTLESSLGGPVDGTVGYSGVSAVFTPSFDLDPSTLYIVTVKGGVDGVKDLAGNPMAGDFVLSWTTEDGPDVTAPQVTATINTDGATEVWINSDIGVTFSEGMDPFTVTNLTFIVESPIGTPVDGTVCYSGISAAFIPLYNLIPFTHYFVTVKGGDNGVKDLAGNPMANNFIWSWTTSGETDVTPPTVLFVNPANTCIDVPINKELTATFSEAMDAMSINTSTFTVYQYTMPVIGTITYTEETAIFTPLNEFSPYSTYTAMISTSANDIAGNALDGDYAWSFTSGPVPDTFSPTLVNVVPANIAIDVPVNSTVSITFSEAMNATTLNTETFVVNDGLTNVAGTVTCSGTVATFTPLSDLDGNTTYSVMITTGAKDLSGNMFAGNFYWYFTTGVANVAVNVVNLGQASTYAVLAGTAVIVNPWTNITGDVGISLGDESSLFGFSQTDWYGYATSDQVIGYIYTIGMAVPTTDMLSQVRSDLTLAYNNAAEMTPVPVDTYLNPGNGNIGGLILPPGLYRFTQDAIATVSFNLQGSANDVWIFQIANSLSISNGVQVTLTGGATEKNIFWQVGADATIGTAVIFYGTIMSEGAINMNAGSVLYGRALSLTGAVSLDQNVIIIPLP